MVMATKTLSKEEKKKLLKLLTYEKVKGKPIYYKDYKKVLKGELPPEAVMGSSELHAILLALIVHFLVEKLGKNYIVAAGELSFYTSSNSIRNLDIAIYKRDEIKKPQPKYTKKTPLVVIEIDTKADLSRYSSFEEYMYEKTQELLDAGVKKVIWFITKVKKVMVAEQGKEWITMNWDRDIEVIRGVKLNLGEILKSEGIEI